MATSEASKAKLPCQFFILGTCRHAFDVDCAFSHDRALCRPGAMQAVCKHYLAGYCRAGKQCLNRHDREARDEALKEQRGGAPEQKAKLRPVGPGLRSVEPPQPGTSSGDGVETKPWTATPRLAKGGSHSPNHATAPEEPTQSQDQFHALLEQGAEQMYFYGELPSEDAQQHFSIKQQQEAPDWTVLAHQGEEGPTEEQLLLWKQQIEAEQRYELEQARLHPTPQQSRKPICRFFQQGNCRFGSACHFSHDLGTSDLMEQVEREASLELECGVCLDIISKTGDGRFGLLTGCDHAFCLKCIKNWRTSDMSHQDKTKDLVRRCPLCRASSFFVVPSDRMVRDPERKAVLIEKYKLGMKKIHCQHFDRGNGACPFGTSCFFAHVYANGKEQDPGELRTYKDADGGVKVDASVRLGAYFDQALNIER